MRPNKKHQLRFSQDARQEANDWYSYSKYDALGRVTEVGRLDNFTNPITDIELADLSFPDRSSYLLKDITTTVWDEDVLYGGTWQENLRMRIAAVFRETDEGTYTARHFYSYDDHGNVDDYRVQLPGLGIKRMEYEYDLVSGNVLEVRYQQGELDFWAHRYKYDSDNRIQEAWTSRNGVIWDRDARYQFYAHGPLARTEIGEDGVQGLDHFYSIHGWIKGVNVAGGFDPGEDGRVPGSSENRWMGRDEMAFGLAFYEGDYDAIGGVGTGALDNAWTKAETNGDVLTASGNGWDAGLYNGNIPWMVTELNGNGQVDMDDFAVSGLQGMAYKYDQLQRLKRAISYRDYASNWNSASTGLYETDYTFDANGNIESLNRWAAKDTVGGPIRKQMDAFNYKYNTTSGEKTNNRLRQVDDAMGVVIPGNPPTGPITWFDNDYDYNDPSGNDAYTYDEIGNLISDEEGHIETILWDNYGKIEAVERDPLYTNAGANLYFEYDGTGNRISKRAVLSPNSNPTEKTTFYVRDPQGNVMAVYDVYEEEEQIITELEELTIYGSDRLGTCHAGTILNEVGVDAGPSSVGNKGVIFAEVMYDSPLTGDPAGKTVPPEINRGEYFVLWNTTPDTVDMGDYQVKNLVNEETVTFSQMVLPPFQWLLVAHADSVEDLQLVTALPWNTLNDNTVQTKLTTEFTMADDKGQLVLSYTSTSEVIDQVDYGSLSGLVATNAYVEENNLDSLHLRVPLKAIQREEISKPAIGFDPANFGTGDLEVQVEPVYNQDWFTSSHERRPGCKVYEMKNHLGNVLATVSDWKIGTDTLANAEADFYLAQVRSLTDYLPFGMEMPGRAWSGDEYRYGFQGQEGDDEWSGSGTILSFEARTYNSRVGVWFTGDKYFQQYPDCSPYNFSLNSPIQYLDSDGNIVRDQDGNIVVKKKKDVKPEPWPGTFNEDGLRLVRYYEVVTIFANDGTEIEAFQFIRQEVQDREGQVYLMEINNEPISDCHGYTFTGGAIWINDDQVEAIVKGDGLKQSSELEADIVIFKAENDIFRNKNQTLTTVELPALPVYKKGKVIHSSVRNEDGSYTSDAGTYDTQNYSTLWEAGGEFYPVSTQEFYQYPKPTRSIVDHTGYSRDGLRFSELKTNELIQRIKYDPAIIHPDGTIEDPNL